MIELYNEDCMTVMARYPDKYFELCICDPPYGIKESSYRANPSNVAAPKKKYKTALWRQEKPNKEYWHEMFRVSQNQIVWGGNYFTNNLPESRCWVIWDKCTQDSVFADVEMAWTSWDKSAKLFSFMWNGMLQGDMKNKETRIHPTQKPVKLYEWLLKNYAKPGDKILDTHGGSMSIAIACHYAGHDLVICEIDKDYFEAGKARIERETRQISLF